MTGPEARGSRPAPLWTCPACRRTFASRRQSHACAPLGDLERHFAGASPLVRQTFDRVLEAVRAIGPVSVLPQKTRIAAIDPCYRTAPGALA